MNITTDVFAILSEFHEVKLQPQNIDLLIDSAHEAPAVRLQKYTSRGLWDMVIILTPEALQTADSLRFFLSLNLKRFVRDMAHALCSANVG